MTYEVEITLADGAIKVCAFTNYVPAMVALKCALRQGLKAQIFSV